MNSTVLCRLTVQNGLKLANKIYRIKSFALPIKIILKYFIQISLTRARITKIFKKQKSAHSLNKIKTNLDPYVCLLYKIVIQILVTLIYSVGEKRVFKQFNLKIIKKVENRYFLPMKIFFKKKLYIRPIWHTPNF